MSGITEQESEGEGKTRQSDLFFKSGREDKAKRKQHCFEGRMTTGAIYNQMIHTSTTKVNNGSRKLNTTKAVASKGNAQSCKGGAKTRLTNAQNTELKHALGEYFNVLDENDVIKLPSRKHVNKDCQTYSKEKRAELLNGPTFADLDNEQLALAAKMIKLAFNNYRKQSFKEAWATIHATDEAAPVVDEGASSLAAAIPVLDKLCSGITDWEVFLEEYGELIGGWRKMVLSEQMESSGTLNGAAIYQEVQKEVWTLLPLTTREEFKEKARVINSNTLKNQNNFLKFTRCSHMSMAEGGWLGKRSIMVTFLICEDEDEGGNEVAKAYSKGVKIPGHAELMDGLSTILGKMVVLSTLPESEKILKIPKNLNGKVVLPLFNPTGMPLELLQDTLKALFRDAWDDVYGQPTLDMPGPPWLAIEQNPEDFYACDGLCVPLRMPETMTREELVKLVKQLSIIPLESNNHFCFFSKEVIEGNMWERQVKEEDESRAGEEMAMMGDVSHSTDGTREDTPLSEKQIVSIESSSTAWLPTTATPMGAYLPTTNTSSAHGNDIFSLLLRQHTPNGITPTHPNSKDGTREDTPLSEKQIVSIESSLMAWPPTTATPMGAYLPTTNTSCAHGNDTFLLLSRQHTPNGITPTHPDSKDGTQEDTLLSKEGMVSDTPTMVTPMYPNSNHQPPPPMRIRNSSLLYGAVDFAAYTAAEEMLHGLPDASCSAYQANAGQWDSNFQQGWQESQHNGVGWSPDVAMSDIEEPKATFGWERLNANLSNNWINHPFPNQLSLPSASSFVPYEQINSAYNSLHGSSENGCEMVPSESYHHGSSENGDEMVPSESYNHGSSENGGMMVPSESYKHGSSENVSESFHHSSSENGGEMVPSESYDHGSSENGGMTVPSESYEHGSSINGCKTVPSESYDHGSSKNGGMMVPSESYKHGSSENGGEMVPSESYDHGGMTVSSESYKHGSSENVSESFHHGSSKNGGVMVPAPAPPAPIPSFPPYEQTSPTIPNPHSFRDKANSSQVHYESYEGMHRELDPMEEGMLNIAGPKKQHYYVNGIPVRRNGVPCGTWKGYAVLDAFDNTRVLTCLMEIEEWVHLQGKVVKLYDRYNNPNGELSRKDYVLY
ncbi:hypothetical protein BT96DRAFT_939742 [Gymnopus androsaceus JB14]|uniref:Uncharacterized protein n=1 Tax=Gymnopus androsaceus JB14 TaxID=1447944 RepID=A0A6A4HMU4_9AGAR|nr:hypothetical protein BT96DRAFT_939742 [Gymnopus androsaceus JB14]